MAANLLKDIDPDLVGYETVVISPMLGLNMEKVLSEYKVRTLL